MKFLYAILFFIPTLLLAQDAQPELAEAPDAVKIFMAAIGPYLSQAIVDYPFLAKFITFTGSIRLLLKPVMSLAWAIFNLTPKSSDNEKYNKITGGKAFGIFAYLVDYFASAKIKNPKE
ncbi:MAG: hypothetical protein Unbinned1322contig1000_46 [Prokaryotic dsDNA virus sp.]|nr:hypothetical protein [Aequorivita sp.]QDP57302.1 MAG: hypothetical protein Unbinned1322contig1000_46 [Prokaryotic dsDNA virus sp.]|tara:strand:- start:26254 stop:26610 length:357 start_codon:yes stop_codon:yes gene_type:complete